MNIFAKLLLFLIGAILMSCSTTPCPIEMKPSPQVDGGPKSMTAEKDLTTRVRVFKPDGSLQCGMGKKIDPQVMQKELGEIQIFSAENMHDGLMRIQVCGHPTGHCNVFEILQADYDKAQKLGFKKWTRD